MAAEYRFGHSGPSISNTAEAKIYLKPQIDMLFYKIISPYLSTELYGLLEADPAVTPWWTLYAGLSSDIGVDIKIWKLTLADFSQNLFDLKILIADAGGTGNTDPVASFTVQPQNGTTATTFLFDASGCHDPDEATSSLEVRWDWEGDGTWDTPFSTTKIATHKYTTAQTYHPEVEVKDSYGATDTESKTLDVIAGTNHPPAASFIVSPPSGTVATLFHFDASSSSDPEDPVTLLEVRWDWEGDGIWDEPYSTVKTATHQYAAGSHHIILEVKDTEGLTDTASYTLQVETGNPTSTLTDPRDGKVYIIVQIGGRWWMAQNLNYGTRITAHYLQKDNGIPEKFCYDDDESGCDVYGGLYQWGETMQYDTVEVTQGICPPGWHVPTVTEWNDLIEYLGSDSIAGGKLKLDGTMYWDAPNTGASNVSGYTAIGAGSTIFNNGMFELKKQQTEYWSSYMEGIFYETRIIRLRYDTREVVVTGTERRSGISVRCIKD